jgi:predicted CXXCH cytochrome family protein
MMTAAPKLAAPKRILQAASFAALLLLLSAPAGAGTPPQSPVLETGSEHSDCNGCHATHHAAGKSMNLKASDQSALCVKCHQGREENLAKRGAIQIPEWRGEESGHLFQDRGERSRGGQPYKRTYDAGEGGRGVLLSGCDGCHDPHAKDSKKLKSVAFDARGEWIGSKPALAAQVCFGCHAGPDAVKLPGQFGDVRDLGTRFLQGARSKHGMGRTAKDRPDLPSLNGTRFNGRLDCTSCHDNPDEAGPRGPHVSIYPHLLVAPYGREREGAVGDRSNDLCYRCHSQMSIEADQSFPLHRAHIRGFMGSLQRPRGIEISAPRALPDARSFKDVKGARQAAVMPGLGEPTPCATCHNPHGSSRNDALVEFDPSVVSPSPGGGISYRRNGPGRGSCTLTCHGYSHVNATY